MSLNEINALVLGVGAMAGGFIAMLAVVRPLLRWLSKQNAIYDMLAGAPAIPGIREAQPSMFERMSANERAVAQAGATAASAAETATKALDLATRAFTLVSAQSGPAVVQVIPSREADQ